MKELTDITERLNKIASAEVSTWQKEATWRQENKEWLMKSAAIAVKIMLSLKSKGWTQVQLAEQLGTSPQHVNKIVKGQENLTLETITKIEACLGVELITVIPDKDKDHPKITTP